MSRERTHLQVVREDRAPANARSRAITSRESEVGRTASPSAGARACATITARPAAASARKQPRPRPPVVEDRQLAVRVDARRCRGPGSA